MDVLLFFSWDVRVLCLYLVDSKIRVVGLMGTRLAALLVGNWDRRVGEDGME
jgi:hypothetical protein